MSYHHITITERIKMKTYPELGQHSCDFIVIYNVKLPPSSIIYFWGIYL